MARPWEADVRAGFRRRIGSSPISADERLVVIPHVMAVAAKQDWPDA